MTKDRRRFLKLGASALGVGLGPRSTHGTHSPAAPSSYDIAVIGAGTFGAWTAWHLRRSGRRVALVDAYGPGNSRASSGGESRVIRMGYGDKELYTRWSQRSLGLWKSLARESGESLFHETGVLWMAAGEHRLSLTTLRTLERLGVRHERLSRSEIAARWPQIELAAIDWAILEPESGVLMARRAVQAVVRQAVRKGVDYLPGQVAPPAAGGRALRALTLRDGRSLAAGVFVFACGPWLPKLFPDLLGERIFPTRQEVFYFGPAAGDTRFTAPAMPVWIDFSEEIYGLPDIEGKGFKVAPDRHGPAFDPDTGERIVTPEGVAAARAFVARRFPALKDAPLVASEVCQYENSSNGDFLIDRHPGWDNVWLAGGGSGHGFKHGPALGEYLSARVLDGKPVEPLFSLATKEKVQKRTVF